MSPSIAAARIPILHYYGVFLSLCTLGLIFVGGMVTSTGSGLAVPDWPTTFGHNMFTFPPSMMKGGIFYEHGHRLAASAVGFLTIGLCLSLWIWDKRNWLRWTGTVSLALVLIQGVLGGITVRYKLPMPVSVSHACIAEIFFLLTVLMAFSTSKLWLHASPPPRPRLGALPILAGSFCMVCFLQILVGAVMRHSYAGLSIPTFPLAFGRIAPDFWNFGIAVNFLHTRVGALVLVGLGTILAGRAYLSRRHARPVRWLSGWLGLLLFGQCLLGMLSIWSGKAEVLTTVHQAAGALVFASSFLLLLAIYRLQIPAVDPIELKENAVFPFSTSLKERATPA